MGAMFWRKVPVGGVGAGAVVGDGRWMDGWVVGVVV